jgi:hypothetical protein
VDFDGISREIDLLNGNNVAPDFARSRGRQTPKKFQRNVSVSNELLTPLTPVAYACKRLKMDSEEPSTDSLGSIQALEFEGSINQSPSINIEQMEESLVTLDRTETLELGKIEALEEGKTAQMHARSLIGDNTLAQSAHWEDWELPDVPDQSEEIDQFVT